MKLNKYDTAAIKVLLTQYNLFNEEKKADLGKIDMKITSLGTMVFLYAE